MFIAGNKCYEKNRRNQHTISQEQPRHIRLPPLDVTLLRITIKQCSAAYLDQNICTPRVICLSVWDAHGQYLRAQLQGEECRFDQKQMSVLTTESVPAQNKSS